MTHNEHTGDPMKSKLGDQAAYSAGYDMIFGKKSNPPRGDMKGAPCQKQPPLTPPSSSVLQPG